VEGTAEVMLQLAGLEPLEPSVAPTTSAKIRRLRTRQVFRSHALGQLLIGTHSSDVGVVGVKGSNEIVYDPQRAKNSKHVLEGNPSVAILEAPQGVHPYAGTIGELDLGQAAQLAPHDDVFYDSPQSPPHRWR
jgi:hypothetical protein